jgi:hypothetical protein
MEIRTRCLSIEFRLAFSCKKIMMMMMMITRLNIHGRCRIPARRRTLLHHADICRGNVILCVFTVSEL